jgi:hypothetical protein
MLRIQQEYVAWTRKLYFFKKKKEELKAIARAPIKKNKDKTCLFSQIKVDQDFVYQDYVHFCAAACQPSHCGWFIRQTHGVATDVACAFTTGAKRALIHQMIPRASKFKPVWFLN